MVKKNPVNARNPFKIMYKGTTHNKKADGMHRPEGAGNFDNMDDYNYSKSVNTGELNVAHEAMFSNSVTLMSGVPTLIFDDTHMAHDKYRIRIDSDKLCFGAGAPNVDLLCLDSTVPMINAHTELDMNTNQINNVVDPTLDQDAATKKYVDDNDHTKYLDAEAVSAVATADDYLKNDAADIGVGLQLTQDNSSADTQFTPQVLYNTDATPPAASGFPIGTLYVQYTA